MSETKGASIPQQASPTSSTAAPTAGTTPSTPTMAAPAEAPQTGWVGWVAFAGMMMVLLGMFHAFQGIIALVQEDYYLVGQNGLTIHVDYTAWGWAHIAVGALVAAAGVGLLAGQMWARVVAVVFAFGSALVNAAFLAAYPVWSAMMIAVDILVIWAVTVHGSEIRNRDTGQGTNA